MGWIGQGGVDERQAEEEEEEEEEEGEEVVAARTGQSALVQIQCSPDAYVPLLPSNRSPACSGPRSDRCVTDGVCPPATSNVPWD